MADQSYGSWREGVPMASRDRRQPQFRGHGGPADPQSGGYEVGPPHSGPTPEPESFTIKVNIYEFQ
jgi:hypothetical protein